jgi:malonyl-CoA decarboxylase
MVAHRSILNRSLRRLRQAWSDLNTTLRGDDRYQFDPALSDKDIERLRQLIRNCLTAPGGEFAARAQAAYIGHAYMSLNQQGRMRFLHLLATDFDADNKAIKKAIQAYNKEEDGKNLAKMRHKLSKALVAPRVQLLTLFNALPEGIKFLVDMRGELLDMKDGAYAELVEVERDLKHLLSSWFDIGFLQLQQLTWNSPAALLEKLIEYEAVHEITSWADLKNRLAVDRRLFAFIHPNMAEEPLIFVQVALCDGLASNVQALLDINTRTFDADKANTAIFYSISNAQRGLAGISFGNFLIKRVVANLKRELPQLDQFATLSPVPGFMSWLSSHTVDDGDISLLNAFERQGIADVATELCVDNNIGCLLGLSAWHQNSRITQVLHPVLMRLCAEYLCSLQPEKLRALDGVAHFHLSNGATIQQLNWMADISPKGIRQSCGMMVNYLYDPLTIDTNSEGYVQTGSIAMSSDIRDLRKEKAVKHVKSVN